MPAAPRLSPPSRSGNSRRARWLRVAGFTLAVGMFLGGCANPGARLTLPKAGGAMAAAAPRETSEAERDFWERLGQARVIYIGETHNRDSDHEYQFDVLKGLKARGVNFAIGWEMFDLTQQPALDQWQARQLGSDALIERTNWRRTWGAQSVMYETMLRWSLAEGIPCVALNAPSALSHKVAFGKALAPEERAMVPAEFDALPGGLEHFTDQMAHSPHAGAGTAPENFYKAQLVWEQTMARRILAFVDSHPDAKLVVLTGRGHLEGGFGVPAFVRQKSGVRQLILFPGGNAPPAADRGGSLARAGQDGARNRVRLAEVHR